MASKLVVTLAGLALCASAAAGCATAPEPPPAAPNTALPPSAEHSNPLPRPADPSPGADEPPSPKTTGSPTPSDVALISASIRNGEVLMRGGTDQVKLGQRVVVKVVSDRADELHVHGYDISRPLQANTPTELSFLANIPGQFEAELHGAHLTVFNLQVR